MAWPLCENKLQGSKKGNMVRLLQKSREEKRAGLNQDDSCGVVQSG